MKNLLWLLFIYCSVVQASQPALRFGIVTHDDHHESIQQYAALQTFLSAQMAPDQVQLVLIEPTNLDLRDIQNKTDFLLTDPYHYLLLKSKGDLRPPLLSEIRVTDSGQFELAGGIIFCLAANPVCDLSKISQASIATTGRYSLFGYVAQMQELRQLAISLPAEALHHLGSEQAVVAAVKSQQMDIGFIRTGVLEDMLDQGLIAPKEMKVLNSQQLVDLPVQSSTRLYPDRPVLVMSSMQAAVVNRMMTALLNWTTHARAAGSDTGFGIAADYQAVEYSLKSLALPPYQDAPPQSYLHSWTDHKGVVLFVTLLLSVFVIVYLLFRQKSTRLRTGNERLHQLNQTLTIQKLR